jgi:hypothetical protein
MQCKDGRWDYDSCSCFEWCDSDEAPDAPDDPLPDPVDASDIPLDPDGEDVEDEG